MKYDYFKEKVNVFIALAPVVRLNNTLSPLFKTLAKYVDPLSFLIVNKLGMYDMFPPTW